MLSACTGWLRRVRGTSSGRPYSQNLVASARRSWKLRRISRGGVMCMVVTLLLGCSGYGAYRVLAGSDIFKLVTISVQGNRMVEDQAVIELAGIERGMNLLRLDVDQVSKRIAGHPWIDSVTVVRSWPSALVLSVQEHRPLAMINFEGRDNLSGLYYVDSDGEVFARVVSGYELDFPVLTGIQDDLEQDGMQIVPGTPAAQALDFLRLVARRGNPVLPVQVISEIHVTPEQELVMYLVDRPFPIYLGSGRMRTKYARLVKILDRLYQKKTMEQVAEIRMDYDENKVLVAKMEL